MPRTPEGGGVILSITAPSQIEGVTSPPGLLVIQMQEGLSKTPIQVIWPLDEGTIISYLHTPESLT